MRTEVPGIGGHLGNRLAGRFEQQAIHQPLVLQRQGRDLRGQREDEVEVRDRQELGLPPREPFGPRHRLALRTMPIATRVVGDLLVVAVVAGRDVSAQRGGAAGADGSEDPLLRKRQASPVPVRNEAASPRKMSATSRVGRGAALIGELVGFPNFRPPLPRAQSALVSASGSALGNMSSGLRVLPISAVETCV